MKIINNIQKICILILAVLLSACEYGDTNIDPANPQESDVPTNAVIPIMQIQSHRNITSILGRFAGILTQQWTGSDAQQVAYSSYVIGETDAENPWNTGLYVGSMRDCVDIINRATEEQNIQSRGLAKLYLAANLGMATNIWGDIPFSEAFLGGENLFPAYDSQEFIYEEIIRLLDEAEEDLSSGLGTLNGNLVPLSTSDWIKVSKSLKARYHLQLVHRDPEASQNALDALAEGAMKGNSDQAEFPFSNSVNAGNGLALFGIQRPNTMIINTQFATFMDNDPRKELYMVQDGGDFLFYSSANTNLFWAQLDSPGVLMTYAEQKFIEAEALERTGADGSSALREAITTNMQYLGITESIITGYVSAISLGGTLENDIEIIIGEKYKALYGNTPLEVWNDYRRTGYPVLTPNPLGVNGLNPSGIIPRRLLYPISERVTNPDSYNAAIEAQGGHLLDDEIWVFPTN